MPIYDFECDECGKITEEFMPMSSNKNPKCNYCSSSNTHKIISACNFTIINRVSQKVKDRANIESDKRVRLREEYGVHEVNPVCNPDIPKRPVGFDQTYKDITSGGSLIKEQMAYTVEKNQKEQDVKSKEWHRKSAMKLKQYKNKKLEDKRNGKKETKVNKK